MRRLLLLGLLATGAHAATFVLCAGVETYDDQRVSRLSYAVADAKAVAAAFRASGVPPKNVALFTSDEKDNARRPTRINLLNALERLKQRAQAGDRLVVFFAGHGIQEGDQQYLLTVDTNRSLVTDTALPMRLVGKALDGVQADAVLFLLDVCRNDPNAGRADNDAALSDGLVRGVRPMLVASRSGRAAAVATLLACDVGQRAWEDPQAEHGAFTISLLRALGGAAAAADGQVRLKALAEYVQQDVRSWAERQGKQQVPKLLNPDESDMVVSVPPPEPVVSVALTDQPLSAVVTLLADQYGAQIVLGKGADGQARVTGKLDNQPLSVVLKILVAAHGLTVRRDQKVYILEVPGAAPEPVAPAPAPPVTAPLAPQKPEETPTEADFTGPVITVAQDGTGQYKTISEAVAAAPEGARIHVKAGTYREHVQPTRRVSLVGQSGSEATVIEDAHPNGAVGIFYTTALMQGFSVRSVGQGPTGVALSVGRSQAAFVDCRFTAPRAGGSVHLGSRAWFVRCSFNGSGAFGLEVILDSVADLMDCAFDGTGATLAECAQFWCATGATAHLARASFRGGKGHAVATGAHASVRLVDCNMDGHGGHGVWCSGDHGPVEILGSRIRGRGAICTTSDTGWTQDERTLEWHDLPAAQPAPPPTGSITIRDCDLRGNPDGAFSLAPGRPVVLSNNLYDPNDATVPKDQIPVAPAEADFTGPVITVAQDGSGQYRTISEAVKAAPEGARIHVKAGTYRERVSLARRLALIGDAGADATAVECADDPNCLGIGPMAIVQGLTFRSVYQPPGGNPFGGAALGMLGGKASFADCRFTSAATSAAWIIGRGQAWFSRCSFTDGLAFGLKVDGSSSADLVDCGFEHNGSNAGHLSPQLGCGTGSAVVLNRVSFRKGPGFAIGVESGASLRMADCVVEGHQSGGIWCSGGHGPIEVVGSRLSANGSYALGTQDWTNDVRDERTGEWRPLQAGGTPSPFPLAPPVIRNCDLRGNPAGAFKLAPGRPVIQSGNQFDPNDPTVPKP